MCGIQDEHSLHVALIYAGIVESKSIDRMISTENHSDSFFSPRPTVLISRMLCESGITVCASAQTLLAFSRFSFSIFFLGAGRGPKYLQAHRWPASGKYRLLSKWTGPVSTRYPVVEGKTGKQQSLQIRGLLMLKRKKKIYIWVV